MTSLIPSAVIKMKMCRYLSNTQTQELKTGISGEQSDTFLFINGFESFVNIITGQPKALEGQSIYLIIYIVIY